MVPICPADPTLCVPIRIGSGESDYGPRLGGRAPEGIYPRHPCDATRFLLTFPLTQSPTLEATVFLHMTTDEMIDGESSIGRDQHLEVVVHPPSRRGRSDRFRSELTPHPLVLGDIVRDEVLDDEGAPLVLSGHKIGGRPFMIHDPLKYIAHSDELLGGSFMQVLQLDFPGSKDAVVSGNWCHSQGVNSTCSAGSHSRRATGDGSGRSRCGVVEHYAANLDQVARPDVDQFGVFIDTSSV